MSALALSSLALLGYTYVGYPLTVAALSKISPMKVRKDQSFAPRVSVLMTVYNAKAHIRAKLESIFAQSYPSEKLEILVYSDASTDGSDEEVLAFADRGVRLVRGDVRRGKPTGLNALRPLATGEVFVMTDVRQLLSPNAVYELVQHLADDRVGCVSGNLVLSGATGAGFYWKYEKFIRTSEANFRGMVGVTGSLYAIRAVDFPEHIPPDLILDDMWIPLRLVLDGKVLTFEEHAVATEEAFEDDREQGRKIRTLAGNFQLFTSMPKLLSPFLNPSFFETTSHKVLRLAGPWLMAGTLAGSLHRFIWPRHPLERGAMGVLLVGQGAFAGLALLGPRAGKVGKLARTFFVLNAAAVQGLAKFASGEQKVTW